MLRALRCETPAILAEVIVARRRLEKANKFVLVRRTADAAAAAGNGPPEAAGASLGADWDAIYGVAEVLRCALDQG